MAEKRARTEAPGPFTVETSEFGTLDDGTVVHRYDLSNGTLNVSLIDYGAHIISIKAPDKDGKVEEVTLSRETLDGILNKNSYFGSTVGRIANRVANAVFKLDDKEYKLEANNGPNHLHGGPKGLDKVVWGAQVLQGGEEEEKEGKEGQGEEEGRVGVRFSYVSPDGEEGYPGELHVQATYVLSSANEVEMGFEAYVEGKACPVALTNHAYYNLSGDLKRRVTDGQTLRVQAQRVLELGEHMIPKGEVSVEGSAFDLRHDTRLGDRVPQVDGGGQPGFDHCFVVDGYKPLREDRGVKDSLRLMAVLKDPVSGRAMDVHGTQPGIQVYTANFLSQDEADAPALQHNAVCLETQFFPNAINDSSFGQDIVIRSGGPKYRHLTVHRFYIHRDE